MLSHLHSVQRNLQGLHLHEGMKDLFDCRDCRMHHSCQWRLTSKFNIRLEHFSRVEHNNCALAWALLLYPNNFLRVWACQLRHAHWCSCCLGISNCYHSVSRSTSTRVMGVHTSTQSLQVVVLDRAWLTSKHGVWHFQQALVHAHCIVLHRCPKPRVAQHAGNVNAVPRIDLQHFVQQAEPSPGHQTLSRQKNKTCKYASTH